MATTIKGRGGTRTRSNYGNYSNHTYGSGNRNWGTTGHTSRTNPNRKTNKRTNTVGVANGYKNCWTDFERKINSYKTLWNQTKGAAKWTRPTPTTLNSFANWINKGAIVQTCTSAQVNRWARATNKNYNNKRNPSPTICKNILTKKFGKSAIKAVARTKSGSWMVATTPTLKGKSFCFPR